MDNFVKKLPFYIKRINQAAILPTKGSQKAAGYDLHSNGDYVVPAKGKQLIKTGLIFAVPSGNYARLAPRSGLAWKNFIDVGAGVIDEDYRGEVGVILFNHSDQEFIVKHGDRIAQVIIEKISDTEIQEVDDLEATQRGENGFGSTGVQQEPPQQSSQQSSQKKENSQQNQLKRPHSQIQNAKCSEDDVEWIAETIQELNLLADTKQISEEQKVQLLQRVINKKEKEIFINFFQN